MMLKIVNKTGSQKIDDAVLFFQDRIPNLLDKLYDLPEQSYFTYTNDTNREVVRKLNHFLAQDKTIEIRPYKTRWPWSSVIGYTSRGKYYINMRKIDSLDLTDYAGNVAHEICHMSPLNYRHGSNYYTEKKRVSVPYALGYLTSFEMDFEEFLILSKKYKGL